MHQRLGSQGVSDRRHLPVLISIDVLAREAAHSYVAVDHVRHVRLIFELEDVQVGSAIYLNKLRP